MIEAPAPPSRPARADLSRPSGLDFFEKFRKKVAGQAKYAQLKDALVAAIESGYWASGQRLPTEPELARVTPFSLGTIQRAMRALVADGLVERRPGQGTFISDHGRRLDDPWHFRFVDDSGDRYLPVFSKVLRRRVVSGAGPWTRVLGSEGTRVIQIDRSVSINDEFRLFSRFYVGAERFPSLLSQPLKWFDGVNLKEFLRREYNLPVTQISYDVVLSPAPENVAKVIGVPVGSACLLLEGSGSAGEGNCVYFQEVFVPPTSRRLRIPNIARST